jgi:hypothetical protein
MFNVAYNETFWLNMTNLGLGLAMLAVVVSLLSAVGKEAIARFKR